MEMTRDEFTAAMQEFKDHTKPLSLDQLEFCSVSFDLEKRAGKAQGDIAFFVDDGKPEPTQISCSFSIEVKFSEFDFWNLCKFDLHEM